VFGIVACKIRSSGATVTATKNTTARSYVKTYCHHLYPGRALRAVLVNTDYYNGTGTRGSESLVLKGLTGMSVKAKRLTAASALSRQDQGSIPSFGKQYFKNGSCNIAGTETYETTSVSGGTATFTVAATEALGIKPSLTLVLAGVQCSHVIF
jgi:hypothetical protein